MFQLTQPHDQPLRRAITSASRGDEAQAVAHVFERGYLSADERQQIAELALKLSEKIRAKSEKASGAEALLREFSLSQPIAHTFLNVMQTLPHLHDENSTFAYLQEKWAKGDWDEYNKFAQSKLANLTRRNITVDEYEDPQSQANILRQIAKRTEETFALIQEQFIFDAPLEEVIKISKKWEKAGYGTSFHFAPCSATTQEQAERHFQQYVNAVYAVGRAGQRVSGSLNFAGSLTVKLSALFARYELAQHDRVMAELLPKLKKLFQLGKEYKVALCIDAESSHNMELTLDILEMLLNEPRLADYHGIGFTIQAQHKAATMMVEYLGSLAYRYKRKLMIRLVNGRDWEQEIRDAQHAGLNGYPVYTRHEHIHLAYLACARMLFALGDVVYPQFETHHAYLLAAIHTMAGLKTFEFQVPYGMGEHLYEQVVGRKRLERLCRIIVPVGDWETWESHLVARMREHGMAGEFACDVMRPEVAFSDLLRSPLDAAVETQGTPDPEIPLPRHLFNQQGRINSIGLDLNDPLVLERLQERMNVAEENGFQAASLLAMKTPQEEPHFVQNPADYSDVVGATALTHHRFVHNTIKAAKFVEEKWRSVKAEQRMELLYKYADALENALPELMALMVRETSKTLAEASAEVRQAVDYCRYYTRQAETVCTGRAPLGTVVVIGSWDSPLAGIVGQTVAALAVGNVVIIKPAEQACLTAYKAIQLLHDLGVPCPAAQLILGGGDVGHALVADNRINGVLFSGSTETAKLINHTLSQRDDLPLLMTATGSLNALIADNTAHIQPLCQAIIQSAFRHAGQHSNALRLVCVPHEIADGVLNVLQSMMDELIVGNPMNLSTDVGAMIDEESYETACFYIQKMYTMARFCHQTELPEELNEHGLFVPPTLLEIQELTQIHHETFAPILHFYRYRSEDLGRMIDQINGKGYALSFAVHSQIDDICDYAANRMETGNVFINTALLSPAAGSRPYGGHAFSGMGAHAGGHFYVQSLCKGTWRVPALHHDTVVHEDALQAVEHLIAQCQLSHDARVRLAGLAGQVRVHNLRMATADLPSIRGMKQQMTWRSPRHVWLHGGTLETALAALLPLSAAGMQVVVHREHLLASHYEHLQKVIRISDNPQQQPFVSHMVALDLPTPELKATLATRKGAIVQIIDARNGLDIIPLFQEVGIYQAI